MTPYDEGYQAYQDGASAMSNPYDDHEKSWEWDDGFDDAEYNDTDDLR